MEVLHRFGGHAFHLLRLFGVRNESLQHKCIVFQNQIADASSFSLFVLLVEIDLLENATGKFIQGLIMENLRDFGVLKVHLGIFSERTGVLPWRYRFSVIVFAI